MLESLDAYRLAKFLHQTDPSIQTMDDMLLKYADPIPLTDNGFPIYVLKTLGEDYTCIFLKEDGCAVYPVRPRTCQLYPFTAGPGQNGRAFEYFLCREKPHHFTGGTIVVKDWMRENFKREMQDFVRHEYEFVSRFGKLMRRIPERNLPRSVTAALFCRYYDYRTDRPFMPQYLHNMKRLEELLAELGEEKQ